MGKKILKISSKFTVIVILLISSCSVILNNRHTSYNLGIQENTKNLKNSGLWAKLTLLNTAINNTNHYHNDTIPIQGNLTEYLDESKGINNYNVSLYVDGIKMSQFNNKTHTENTRDGYFNISFTIPFNLSIYQSHKIEVNVTDDLGLDIVQLQNFYIINLFPRYKLNLTNDFEVNNTDHYHNDTISIKGRLYEYFSNVTYPSTNLNVSIYIDGLKYDFNNLTYDTSNFTITFEIPFSLAVYQSHVIEVNITQGPWVNDVVPQNSFIINLVPYIRINLTNYMINNSYNFHNDTIAIKGKVYKYLDYLEGIPDQNVSLYIDGQLQSSYKAITDSNGEFQINYTITSNFGLYQAYKIEVNLTQGVFINESVLDNYFIFYIKANSDLELTYIDSLLKLTGEIFRVEGILRYDYHLGAGIPNAEINYFWYNSTFQWPVSSFFTRATDGSFSENLRIPTNAYSSIINLNMSFLGDYPNIGYSDVNITNIKLFSNIRVNWNVLSKARVGANITIAGQVVSYTNNSLLIVNRSIIISYDGTQIGTNTTDENGEFTYIFTIPGRTGNMTIKIEIVNSASVTLDGVRIINVTAVPFVPTPGTAIPPFLIFSLVFFPILIGIIAVLAVFGYRYYKKQEKESRIVRIELDPKLLNLKILKESGRLEESLSYLFNAIFMNLIEAKYNRSRKENETIRDFAIVSVKELKLTPAAIYPFIQKVEEIIYGKPFKITDNEFYKTCELFSPLYFELTGDNFILNF